MELEAFRERLRSRGNEASVWLVYLPDPSTEVLHDPLSLLLQQAFWTRGEAYAFAERGRNERGWQHFYVFRVSAHVDWVGAGGPWPAEFETGFGRARGLPDVVLVTAEDVARGLTD